MQGLRIKNTNRTLCPEQVETSLCAVDAFAEKTGLDKQHRLKLRLLVEELLLIYRDALGEDSMFSVRADAKTGNYLS